MKSKFLLTSLFLFGVFGIETPNPKGPKSRAIPGSYIVVFDDSEQAPGTAKFGEDLEKWAEERKIGFSKVRNLTAQGVLNAISINIEDKDAKAIARAPGVKHVTPNYLVVPSQSEKLSYDLPKDFRYTPHEMTGVDKVQKELKLTGAGIKVGVIDSGIDYNHPGLGGCFKGQGCRVAYGKDLVGDDFNPGFAPQPDDDPLDQCGGHGTHVAGIIGADDQYFKGVAPEVTIGAYRVFGCKNGQTSSTDTASIIAGLIAAYEDGMDIVNMSLGGGSQWPDYPTGVASSNLAKKGMVIFAAAGNEGADGIWTISEPSIGEHVISVASIDNTKYISKTFTINTKPDFKFGYPSNESNNFEFKDQEVVHVVDDKGSDLACEDNLPPLTGKIALIRRGNCFFVDKTLHAQNAGAIGVIIFDNVFGLLNIAVTADNLKIPAIGITKELGELLLEELKKGAIKVTTQQEVALSDVPSGSTPSDFTNWGPDARLNLKPDIAAPGGLIFSTYPLPLGGYAILSGTSMATPYAAGAAALWLQSKRNNNSEERSFARVAELTAQFSHSAKPVKDTNSDDLAPTIRQGAGLINLYDTLKSQVTISPQKVTFQDTQGRVAKTTTFTIQNDGSENLEFEFDHELAPSVKGYDNKKILLPPVKNKAGASVKFLPPKVSLKPGKNARVRAIVSPDRSLNDDERWLFGGWFVAKSTSSDGQVYRVPYVGLKGDFHTQPILPGPESGTPFLLDQSQNTINSQTVLDFTTAQFAIVYFSLIHPTGLVKLEVFDSHDILLGEAEDSSISYYGRSIPGGALDAFFWDGSFLPASETGTKTVDNGKYKLKLKVLKPLGNPINDQDFETWESVTFSVITSQN